MRAVEEKFVILGYVSGVYGIKGWIKVFSYTEPRDNIVGFRQWRLSAADPAALKERVVEVEAGGLHGKQVIAKLVGVDDRDQAAELIGSEIAVPRSALPACDDETYYWADLIGLSVRNEAGEVLGVVERMLETGAHDVMVLNGDGGGRMIPFVMGRIVQDVDLAKGVITVKWESSYWEQ